MEPRSHRSRALARSLSSTRSSTHTPLTWKLCMCRLQHHLPQTYGGLHMIPMASPTSTCTTLTAILRRDMDMTRITSLSTRRVRGKHSTLHFHIPLRDQLLRCHSLRYRRHFRFRRHRRFWQALVHVSRTRRINAERALCPRKTCSCEKRTTTNGREQAGTAGPSKLYYCRSVDFLSMNSRYFANPPSLRVHYHCIACLYCIPILNPTHMSSSSSTHTCFFCPHIAVFLI